MNFNEFSLGEIVLGNLLFPSEHILMVIDPVIVVTYSLLLGLQSFDRQLSRLVEQLIKLHWELF
jgi:hypothetical protein